jgi:nucleoside-diphosphate-sugar epimerase
VTNPSVSIALGMGAAYFIGPAVSRQLPADSRRVVVSDNRPSVLQEYRATRLFTFYDEVELIVGGFADPGAWNPLPARVPPYAVERLAKETGTTRAHRNGPGMGRSALQVQRRCLVLSVGQM